MNPKQYLQSVDPILAKVIAQIDIPQNKRRKANHFRALVQSIIAQQLSDKAADTLILRFKKLYPGKPFPRPEDVLATPDDAIRTAGLSYSKASYIKDLAQRIVDKRLNLRRISKLSDEEIITVLTEVKGIGKWTAEMFLMFSLERPDVFSHGDLGLRNAIKRLYGFKDTPSEQQIEKIVCKWSPHKTLACRYLWKSLYLKS